MRVMKRIVPLLLALCLLAGCGQTTQEMDEDDIYIDRLVLDQVDLAYERRCPAARRPRIRC